MKKMAALQVLVVLAALAGPAQAQDMDDQSGQDTPLPSGSNMARGLGYVVVFPEEVPPGTCVYNNFIHSMGARICVGYDLATCTEGGAWDHSEQGAKDAQRCSRK